jgi:L-ascorbate metabolism protein UlaG (beta-lactamase superfamily)
LVSRPAELTWLGHATVLVEIAGARLLTDPVLRPRVGHLVRHVHAPELPGDLDAVLVSHLHRDHLDRASLRGLPAGTRVVGPRGTAAVLRRRRPELDVVEVDCGDEVRIGDVTARATPARHDGRRHPLARERGTALGFLVSDARTRVYFAGDTDLFAGMERIGADGLDAALLPVWGWGPKLGPGHLDPEGAAHATALLRPDLVVPIHWGTYLPAGLHRRHGGLLHTPAQEFAEAAARLAPGVRVAVLRPGEALGLRGGARRRDHAAHPEAADDEDDAVHDEGQPGQHGERREAELRQGEHADADDDVDQAAERAQQALIPRDDEGADQLDDP